MEDVHVMDFLSLCEEIQRIANILEKIQEEGIKVKQ